ncbi:MAG TPA: prepilin-type N-terminal cleavage/methylation domain-containing protein [Gemmatimonadaceae bacterium]|nr:prepilin-type N-terminal cleavage/methylation domain-containing protein [Gemmatimonadaceae bacterium]
MKRRRSGFSLAEVLVATVLLGIIGGALTRLVVDQMRFFDTVQVSRGARSAARNSMNVMLSELRMVQDSGGITAVANDNKSVTVNVPYRFGVFCGNAGGATVVSMLPIDSMTLAMAQYAGYGWRSRTTGRYTMVPSTTAPVSSSSATQCTGTGATEAGIATITINGRPGAVMDITPTMASTTTLGSPVMFYQSITYSFAASSLYPGKVGLWRTVANGTSEELMAPFTANARFRYYQSGDDTSRTAAPALSNIRGLALVLHAEGARTPVGQSAATQAKMMTSVFFKNTRSF